MYFLIALGCFAAAVLAQLSVTRTSKLAQVRRFRALGVSDDRAQQFYRETALAAFREKLPWVVLQGVLLAAFCVSIVWMVVN